MGDRNSFTWKRRCSFHLGRLNKTEVENYREKKWNDQAEGKKHHQVKGEVEEEKSLKYKRKKKKLSNSKGDIYRQTHEVSCEY